MEIPNQEQVWDKIALPWKNVRKIPFPDAESFIKSKQARNNLLDLGCGSGRNFIKKQNLKIYGVDFSGEQLKYAREKADQLGISVNLKHSGADKLDFKDNFFDCAVFIATLHCLPSKTARKKSLQELFRVLKPKAKAIITVWSRNHARIKNKTKDNLLPWSYGILDDKSGGIQMRYYYIYDQNEFKDLLESVGFKILSLKEDKNIIAIIEKKN